MLSLRELIPVLERKGRLKRISQVVDPAWEPASLIKWMFQALPRPGSIDHRAHGQFRLRRHPDLAHQDEVERRVESRRHLGRVV